MFDYQIIYLKKYVQLFRYNPLFALNLARIEDRISRGEENEQPFSMMNYKRIYSNKRMLNLFIYKFGIDLSSEKMRIAYDEMLKIGTIAS